MQNKSLILPFSVETVKYHHSDGMGGVACYPEVLESYTAEVLEQTLTVSQITGPRLFGNWNGYVYQRSKPLSVERKALQPAALSFSFEESYGTPSPCGRTTHSYYALAENLLSGGDVRFDQLYLLNPLYEELCVTKAKQMCLDNASEVAGNLAISLIEAGKSWEMILGTARAIATSIRHVRRGDIRRAWRTISPDVPFDPKRFKASLRGVARRSGGRQRRQWENDWLALQYGWVPMLKDASDAASVVAQRFSSSPKVFSASGRSHLNGHTVSGGGGNPYYQYWYSKNVPGSTIRANYKADVYRETSFKARAGITCAVSSPTLVNINQTVGNPLSVIWELVPGSFLADWLFAVGDYLRNMTALNGLTVLDGWVATERRFKDTAACKSSGDGTGGTWLLTNPGLATSERVLFSRYEWQGQISFSLGNTAINGGRWQQLVTVVALIKQQWR